MEVQVTEQVSAPESAVPPSEPAPGFSIAGNTAATDTTEPIPETDEQKNARAQREEGEKVRRQARGVQVRINELTEEKRAALRMVQEANAREAALLELVRGNQRQPAGQQQPDADAGPQRSQFNDYEDYIAKVAEWKAEKATDARWQRYQAEMTHRQQQAAVMGQVEQVRQQFQNRIAEFAKTVPDYAEVVLENHAVQIPESVGAALHLLPNGPAIMYHIGKNPDLVKAFHGKTQLEQSAMLGEISQILKSAPGVSNAPSPGKPVGARSGGSETPPNDPGAYNEWRKKHIVKG